MQYKLTPADLEVALAMSRGGTLALAGERLGVDASTVFRALQRIERGLGQRLTVLVLADLALVQGQLKLGLLLGKGARSLGRRVVLVVQAGKRGLRLRYTLVDTLRHVLLRLTSLDFRDFLLDVLAGFRVLLFLGSAEAASGKAHAAASITLAPHPRNSKDSTAYPCSIVRAGASFSIIYSIF